MSHIYRVCFYLWAQGPFDLSRASSPHPSNSFEPRPTAACLGLLACFPSSWPSPAHKPTVWPAQLQAQQPKLLSRKACSVVSRARMQKHSAAYSATASTMLHGFFFFPAHVWPCFLLSFSCVTRFQLFTHASAHVRWTSG